MKKWIGTFGLVVVILMMSGAARAQTQLSEVSHKQAAMTSQSISATGAQTGVSTIGYSTVMVTITGTYAGVNVKFEGSPDGANYSATPLEFYRRSDCARENSTGSLTNTVDQFLIDVTGFIDVRANCTAYGSGTAALTITCVSAPATECTTATLQAAQTGTAGSPSAVVVSVQGVSGGTNLPVSVQNTPSGNVAQFGGSNVVTGTGASGSGVPRVTISNDSSLAAHQSTNVDQIAGTTPAQSGVVAGTLGVGGDTPSGSTSAGNPLQDGGVARNAPPTAVSNGQRVGASYDVTGRVITSPYSNPENLENGSTSAITGTSSTQVLAAAGSGLRNYITSLTVTNSGSTGTLVQIEDGSNVIWQGYAAPSGGGFTLSFPAPLRGSANTAVNVVCGTSGANVYVSAAGYIAP